MSTTQYNNLIESAYKALFIKTGNKQEAEDILATILKLNSVDALFATLIKK